MFGGITMSYGRWRLSSSVLLSDWLRFCPTRSLIGCLALTRLVSVVATAVLVITVVAVMVGCLIMTLGLLLWKW